MSPGAVGYLLIARSPQRHARLIGVTVAIALLLLSLTQLPRPATADGQSLALSNPNGVAADAAGGLFVSDTLHNRVFHYAGSNTVPDRVYGQNGSFNTTSANIGPMGLNQPSGLATDQSGGLFVTDSGNNRVLHFSGTATTADRVYGQSGSFTSRDAGTGPAGLYGVGGVAVDQGGGLYVSEADNHRVLHFSGAGTTADRVYGQNGSFTSHTAGSGATGLHGPTAVAVDQSGGLYVADWYNNRVLQFTGESTSPDRVYGQHGSFTTAYTDTSAIGLWGPLAVAVDPAAGLYVADAGNKRVLHFSRGSLTADAVYGQAGNFSSRLASISMEGLAHPQGLSIDPTGGLFVADTDNNRVLHFGAGSTTPDRIYGQNGRVVYVAADGGLDGIDLTSGERTQLVPPGNLRVHEPVWSPDGSQIAFLSSQSTDESNIRADDIYVLPASGGQPQQVSKLGQQLHDLTWFPNGRDLLFATGFNGGFQSHVLHLDDGSIVDLATDVDSVSPRLSPDGSHIAALATTGSDAASEPGFDVYDADGQNRLRIVNVSGTSGPPGWASDTSLAYADGKTLKRTTIDGAPPTTITELTIAVSGPVVYAPDGEQLVVVAALQPQSQNATPATGVVVVSRDGSEAGLIDMDGRQLASDMPVKWAGPTRLLVACSANPSDGSGTPTLYFVPSIGTGNVGQTPVVALAESGGFDWHP